MNNNVKFVKVLLVLGLFMPAGGSLICHADDAMTEHSSPGIALQDDAPIYMGPVQEGDLEDLALDDFEAFGMPSVIPEEQYRRYNEILDAPPPNVRVPYRMKVIDRDLTQEDFFGFNVTEELSAARYQAYVSMNPETVDGQTLHYVYVYHAPLPRVKTRPHQPDENRTHIDLKEEV
jgi:hypothetical protein